MSLRGFSVLELLVALSLFLVLSLFSISSLSYLIHKNEKQTLVDEIKRAVQYAKVQSLVRGVPLVLSPLDPDLDWSKGIVLTESTKDNKINVLYQWKWNHPRWMVNWLGANSNQRIKLSSNVMTAISNGKFVVTNTQTKEQLVLVLNRIGRIRMGNAK